MGLLCAMVQMNDPIWGMFLSSDRRFTSAPIAGKDLTPIPRETAL